MGSLGFGGGILGGLGRSFAGAASDENQSIWDRIGSFINPGPTLYQEALHHQDAREAQVDELAQPLINSAIRMYHGGRSGDGMAFAQAAQELYDRYHIDRDVIGTMEKLGPAFDAQNVREINMDAGDAYNQLGRYAKDASDYASLMNRWDVHNADVESLQEKKQAFPGWMTGQRLGNEQAQATLDYNRQAYPLDLQGKRIGNAQAQENYNYSIPQHRLDLTGKEIANDTADQQFWANRDKIPWEQRKLETDVTGAEEKLPFEVNKLRGEDRFRLLENEKLIRDLQNQERTGKWIGTESQAGAGGTQVTASTKARMVAEYRGMLDRYNRDINNRKPLGRFGNKPNEADENFVNGARSNATSYRNYLVGIDPSLDDILPHLMINQTAAVPDPADPTGTNPLKPAHYYSQIVIPEKRGKEPTQQPQIPTTRGGQEQFGEPTSTEPMTRQRQVPRSEEWGDTGVQVQVPRSATTDQYGESLPTGIPSGSTRVQMSPADRLSAIQAMSPAEIEAQPPVDVSQFTPEEQKYASQFQADSQSVMQQMNQQRATAAEKRAYKIERTRQFLAWYYGSANRQ